MDHRHGFDVLVTISPLEITGAFRALEVLVQSELPYHLTPTDSTSCPGAAACITWQADLRYAGQAFELTVPLPPTAADALLTQADITAVAEAFEAEHERTCGHRAAAGAAIVFVVLRVIGTVPPQGAAALAPLSPPATAPEHALGHRPVYFGPDHGLRQTQVIGRNHLAAGPARGPLIIEEYEGTAVVPPNATVHLDRSGMLVIDLGEA